MTMYIAYVKAVNPINNEEVVMDCNKLVGEYDHMIKVSQSIADGCRRCGMKVLTEGVIELEEEM
jgi:hypothetical protein